MAGGGGGGGGKREKERTRNVRLSINLRALESVIVKGIFSTLVPRTTSKIKMETFVVIQQQFVVSLSRQRIAQWRSVILFISSFHPQTNCHSLEVWHASC